MKRVLETHELPTSREELMEFLSVTLARGKVQKVVIEIGKPIKVTRLVKVEDAPNEPEVPLNDLYSEARNATIEELPFTDGNGPYEVLFKAFNTLENRKLVAKSILCNNRVKFCMWLGIDFVVGHVYGIPIVTTNEVPEGVSLIVAVPAEDRDGSISYSLKIETPLPRPKERKKK